MLSKKVIFITIFFAALCSSHVASAKNPDVSHLPKVLIIDAGKSNFFSTFSSNQKNGTFTDNFYFSIGNSYKFVADLFAPDKQFKIDDFNLYDQSDKSWFVEGTQAKKNKDTWNLSLPNLEKGDYFLQVVGKLKFKDSSLFRGELTVSPVPEADIYTMLLAGLGLICFLSRRRHASEKFS